ncbi:GNAT family N-acetyltransferase [Planosporangium flavigriseum]|uniref:N-acetyltransferase domain-containing protein n=1 Tax=Planosporangium flavigriseum TaxID=373681 RepID=A0A8J3LRU0_9ACTN|nr:GNAT family N-acetyltransferase [Planosporangium flavigriseum]NJC67348.1 GNAT family N-acetyltransferase [Planosporangium flavigriseum]GIG75433.1 hypothetical protein Pfl04_38370 [Planosporangium flavigriseum]
MAEPVTTEAWRDARAAARSAGVDIGVLTGADVAIAQCLIERVWGPREVPQRNLLRAVAHAGNTLLLARRDSQPIGFVLGFLGWAGGLHLHSHMAAVIPGDQSRGVGYALKLWQRALCLQAGVDEMRWTYDPLIARNAHFNLVKLGADVVAYRPDFYGAMDDAVNAGDHSDRFEVSWRLRRPVGPAAGRRGRAGRVVAVLEIPKDYEALRRFDPGQARQVRQRARETIERAFAAGCGVEWSQDHYEFIRYEFIRSKERSNAARSDGGPE